MNKTQEKLIEATERLLQREGLARVTTRKIAKEAGIAEGAIYHHFADKAELLLAVAQQKIGDFREVLDSLPLQVGRQTVAENLEQMLKAAFAFQLEVSPIISSLFADHALLRRTREILEQRQVGPDHSAEALAAYLMAEQRLGRVSPQVSPEAAAQLLLASSFKAAMFDRFYARVTDAAEVRHRIRETVKTLLLGLHPREAGNAPIDLDRNRFV